MPHILFENGKKLGEISEWKLNPYEPVYKDVLGKMILSPERPDECTFVVPKPVSRKSKLTLIEDQKQELVLEVKSVKGMTVKASIVSRTDLD